jgi:hypothetical protein
LARGISINDAVEPMRPPHPVFERTQKITASQAAELSHLGITTDHTVIDVVPAAVKIHPQLKLRTF